MNSNKKFIQLLKFHQVVQDARSYYGKKKYIKILNHQQFKPHKCFKLTSTYADDTNNK